MVQMRLRTVTSQQVRIFSAPYPVAGGTECVRGPSCPWPCAPPLTPPPPRLREEMETSICAGASAGLLLATRSQSGSESSGGIGKPSAVPPVAPATGHTPGGSAGEVSWSGSSPAPLTVCCLKDKTSCSRLGKRIHVPVHSGNTRKPEEPALRAPL